MHSHVSKSVSSQTFLSGFLGLSVIAAAFSAADANANPSGGSVVSGSASIVNTGATRVDINQTSNRAVINWQDFSINVGEHTNFNQPSANAVALNRVIGQDPSKILGKLTANGQVMLVNPNGVFFGKNATVDVAGLVASTADITNEDFMAGRYLFNIAGKAGASIVNEGNITVASGGIAAFVAPSVHNNGVIAAQLGKVALAAGDTFTLDLYGDNLVNIAVSDDTATALAETGEALEVGNSGEILSNGGTVVLSAADAKDVVNSVINMSGVITADAVAEVGGKIVLQGADVNFAGTLNSDGGDVAIKADNVQLGGDFNVSNGTLLVDPNVMTVVAGAAADPVAANQITVGTIVDTMALNTDMIVEADKRIDVNADIDTTGQGNTATLELRDENTDLNDTLNVNLNALITLDANQTLIGDATRVNINHFADGGLQNAVAIADASNASSIFLAEGTYTLGESVTINKPITLRGDRNGAGSVIDATSAGNVNVLLVQGSSADNSMLRDFDIQAANGATAIRVEADGVNINRVDVDGAKWGVMAKNVDDLTVQNGTFINIADDGVRLENADNSLVRNMVITAPNDDGIQALHGSENTTFQNNTVTDAGGDAIRVLNSDDILLNNNTLTGSAEAGIQIDGGAERVDLQNNTLTNNVVGIQIDDTSTLDVVSNNKFIVGAQTSKHIVNNTANTLDFVNSDFDGVDSRSLTLSELFAVEDLVDHGLDNASNGAVYFGDANHLYVTTSTLGLQQAVTTATVGDVINLAASAFDTSSQIVIDKNLTISGQGKGSTTITTSFDTGTSGDARGWFLVDSGAALDLENLTVDGSGQLVYQAFRDKGTGSSYDNVAFANILYNPSSSYQGVAIAAFGAGAVNVTNSDFSNIGRVGVLYFGAGVAGSIYDNNTYTGKGAGNWLDYGVEVGAGATAIIRNSTFDSIAGIASSDGSVSAGVMATTYFGAGTEATLQGNTFSNGSNGVFVGFDAADTSTVRINNNNQFTNLETAVSASSASVLNVTNNTFTNVVDAVDASTVADLDIKNNSITGTAAGTAIEIENSAGAVISGNTIDAFTTGVELTGTTTVTGFSNNTFTNVSGQFIENKTTNDVNARAATNTYGGISGNTTDVAEGFALEDKFTHVLDNAGYGRIIFGNNANTLYVTTSTLGLQHAVNTASNNYVINIANGAYSLGSSTLTISGKTGLDLIGQSRAGVLIDSSGINGGYGILVEGNGTVLSGFTLQGPSGGSGAYGIKVQPDTLTSTDVVSNVTISDITVQGSGRSEIDINAGRNITIDNVTVDGQNTGGVGIAVTDSRNIFLSNITTTGNTWGGIGLYAAGRYYTGGVNNVHVTGTNSFAEANPLYTQVSNGFDVTNVNLPDFTHFVSAASTAPGYGFYQLSEANSLSFFETGLFGASDTVIQTLVTTAGLTTVQNNYIVGQSGAAVMSIQTAVDHAAATGTINVNAGTYTEDLNIAKELTLLGANAGVASNGSRGAETVVEASLAHSVTSDNVLINGFTFNGANGLNTVDSTGQVTITNNIFNGTGIAGSVGVALNDDATVTNNTFNNFGTAVLVNAGVLNALSGNTFAGDNNAYLVDNTAQVGFNDFLSQNTLSSNKWVAMYDRPASLFQGQVYSTIQGAVDGGDTGDTAVASAGTFNEAVYINRDIHLTGQGQGSTVIDATGLAADGIDIDNNGVTISSLSINSGNATAAGIYTDADNITIQNVTIDGFLDGILTESASNVTISNNLVRNTGQEGISLYESTGSVSGNTISDVVNDGIKLELSTATVSNNNISGTFDDGVDVAFSDNSVISGNTITGDANADAGINIDDSTGVTISANTVTTATAGITINNSDNAQVNGNNQINSTEYGVYVVESDGVTVSGNTVNTAFYGIMSTDADNVTFTNNTLTNISGFGVIAGWVFTPSTGATITGNNVTGLAGSLYGVGAGSYSNVTIDGNTVSGFDTGIGALTGDAITVSNNILTNVDYGIDGYDATNLVISDNNITGNSIIGMELEDTVGVQIDGNTLSTFTDGIVLAGSTSVASFTNNTLNTITDQYIENYTSNSLNVNGNGNTFDGVDVGTLNSTTNLEQLFDFENKITHDLDNASYGRVVFGDSTERYVTTSTLGVQHGIDVANANDTVFVRNGTYNESLNIAKNVDVVGQSARTIIQGSSANTPVITLSSGGSSSADRQLVSGLNIQGGTGANGHGIAITGGNGHVQLDSLTIANNAGDGVNVNTSGTYTDLVIENSTISNNDNGVRVAETSGDLDGFTLFNTLVENNTSNGLSIEGNGNTAGRSNIAIDQSTIRNNGGTAEAYLTGINGGLELTDSVFTSNGDTAFGIFLSGTDAVSATPRNIGTATFDNVLINGTQQLAGLRIENSTDAGGITFVNGTEFDTDGPVGLSLGNITGGTINTGTAIFQDTNSLANIFVNSTVTQSLNVQNSTFVGAEIPSDVLVRIVYEDAANAPTLFLPTVFLTGDDATREGNRGVNNGVGGAQGQAPSGFGSLDQLIAPAAGEGAEGTNPFILSSEMLALVQLYIETGEQVYDEDEALRRLLENVAFNDQPTVQ